MGKIHDSHVVEAWGLNGVIKQCSRYHMCTCHSMHKMVVECERIDGRKKEGNDEGSGSE